ncbi:MAG: hypothetical protein ABSE86_03175 [Bryobacteraceae bacterium]|jgi:hypothetical protein
MKVLLRIKPPQPTSRAFQVRQALSWAALYLFGVGLMMALVFLITGAFPR